MATLGKRKIQKPTRFGQQANNSDLSQSEILEDPFADDSMDDQNYLPDELDASTADQRPQENQAKRKRVRTSGNVDVNLDIDLNDEFNVIQEELTRSKIVSTNVSKSSNLKEDNSRLTTNASESADDGILRNIDSKLYTGQCGETKQHNANSDLIQKLYYNSVEALARLSTIEDALIKNGVLKPVKAKTNANDSAVEAFMVANNLPLKALDGLEMFELNLKNDAFKQTAVSKHIVNFSHLMTVKIVGSLAGTSCG